MKNFFAHAAGELFSNSSSSIYFHWNNNPADRHLHLFHLNVHVTHSTYTGSTFDWRENDILHTYWGDIMYFGVCFLWRFPCHFTMLSLNSTVYFLINIRTLCGRARSTLCCVFSGSHSSPLHSFGNKTEKHGCERTGTATSKIVLCLSQYEGA